MSNRILFDTNIWNYLADHSSVPTLKRAMHVGATIILVAPSTLYEALRVQNTETRSRRAAMITDQAWTRLMPEAYSESQELLGEIRRLRPQWLKRKGNRAALQRLRHDWGRTKAGFWQRVRSNPDQEAKYIAQLSNHDLEIMRTHAYAQRKQMITSDWDATTPLNDVVAMLKEGREGYDGNKIQAWRMSGWSSTTHALKSAGHPYPEWLVADVDFDTLIHDKASWLRFWFYEVEASRMPRFWLRWAFEYYQLFYRVSDGTPGDAQLATYLLDADVVISADKNFLRITDVIRPYSEFPIASTKLVAAETKGIMETLDFIQTKRR
jgi:hypothetical protein